MEMMSPRRGLGTRKYVVPIFVIYSVRYHKIRRISMGNLGDWTVMASRSRPSRNDTTHYNVFWRRDVIGCEEFTLTGRHLSTPCDSSFSWLRMLPVAFRAVSEGKLMVDVIPRQYRCWW